MDSQTANDNLREQYTVLQTETNALRKTLHNVEKSERRLPHNILSNLIQMLGTIPKPMDMTPIDSSTKPGTYYIVDCDQNIRYLPGSFDVIATNLWLGRMKECTVVLFGHTCLIKLHDTLVINDRPCVLVSHDTYVYKMKKIESFSHTTGTHAISQFRIDVDSATLYAGILGDTGISFWPRSTPLEVLAARTLHHTYNATTFKQSVLSVYPELMKIFFKHVVEEPSLKCYVNISGKGVQYIYLTLIRPSTQTDVFSLPIGNVML